MEMGPELSLHAYSLCNCLEVLGSMAHSEENLKWLELGGRECGNEWRGLERREVDRDDE